MLTRMTPTPLPTVEAGSGDPTFGLATVIVSLVVGLLGGAISAFITTKAQKHIARANARATAASALWTFQRTLHDYGSEGESHFVDDGSVTFTKTSAEDIASARVAAYPYRGYLGDKATLVERHWRAEGWEGDDPLIPYNDVYKWSQELGSAIKAEFGKDPR